MPAGTTASSPTAAAPPPSPPARPTSGPPPRPRRDPAPPTLAVDAAPAVTQQPVPASVCAGQPATFTVLATGTGPLTYQWRRNGEPVADGPGITGAATATLHLAAAAPSNAGSYDC